MSANEFRKRAAREDRDRHLKKEDWICGLCSGRAITIWHAKGEPCPRVSAEAQAIRGL